MLEIGNLLEWFGKDIYIIIYSALFCCIILCVLSGCTSQYYSTAAEGTDFSLTCKYDVWRYGRLPFCWARGSLSWTGCNNQVLKSDGRYVSSRVSWRYYLSGNLAAGDASLTIRNVQESDSGKYFCRVEIPGWFNDKKVEHTLNVYPGHPSNPNPVVRELKQRAVTVGWSPPFNGGQIITAYLINFKEQHASWYAAKTSRTSWLQVNFVDLHPFTTYNLRMLAINSVGMGSYSNVLTFTTHEAAPEGPPLDMQLQTLSSQSIRVTWKPPKVELRNGILRSYIIRYREYYPVVKTWVHLSKTATGHLESFILTNLKPSTKYDVLIQARTNAGLGPASTAPLCSTLDKETTTTSTTTTSTTTRVQHTSLSAVPPDPHVIWLQEVVDNTISLFWTIGFEGDSPISGFYLEYKALNASWDYTETVVDFNANETEATIIEFNPSTYNIRMFAKNSLGTSKASNVLTVTIEDRGINSSSSSPGCISLYVPKTSWDFMMIFLVYLLWLFWQTSEFNLCFG